MMVIAKNFKHGKKMYHTNLGCRSLLFIAHRPTVRDLQYEYFWLSEATILLTMMSMYADKV